MSSPTGGGVEEQGEDESSEESGTRSSQHLHNPLLRLALGSMCIALLVVVFLVGTVIRVYRAFVVPKQSTHDANVTDAFDINLVTHDSGDLYSDIDLKAPAHWPIDLFPLNWSFFGLRRINVSDRWL